MLQSPDGMRRCAAAMVLAEIAPKDTAVVKALGEALPQANQMLTRYILEALENIGNRAVVPYVLPLLEAADVETKLRAAGIIARVGGEMVNELKKQFATASPQQKRVLVEIVARIHSRDALQIILDTFFDPDAELAKEACDAMRRHMGEATPKERAAMHRQVVAFMQSARGKRDERVLANCLLLVGYIGAPDARRILVKYAAPRNPSFMRRNALLGLKGLNLTGTPAAQVAQLAFKFLDETDWQNIVQHALDLIERLPLPRAFEAQWRKLLDNKHPSVRNFAARKIAASDTPLTNALLMKLLGHDDPSVSEIASGALGRHKGATKLLLGALARETKSDRAWRLAKILRPHSESVDRATMKRFAAMAARDLEAGNPRHEALMYFLRNTNAAAADEVMHDVGLKFKKAKKWHRAIDCIRPLIRGDGSDNELRFDLNVCHLKQSAKDMAPHLRAEDDALRGLQPLLLDKKLKLIERLKKEKALDAEDWYYVGFHFSEGTGEERKFGRALLEHVVKKWPRAKQGKAAKEKLKLTSGA